MIKYNYSSSFSSNVSKIEYVIDDLLQLWEIDYEFKQAYLVSISKLKTIDEEQITRFGGRINQYLEIHGYTILDTEYQGAKVIFRI